MAMIYDLDNEGGGQILSDSDSVAPALQINSNACGYPALAILSTASGNPLHVRAISTSTKLESAGAVAAVEVNSYSAGYPGIQIASTASGYPIDVTAINETYGARFRSAITGGVAAVFGKSVIGSPTIAPVKILHPSCASGVVLEFGGGFISCTSVDFTGSAKTDYVLPISLGGVVRGIPLMSLAGITGGAAVS